MGRGGSVAYEVVPYVNGGLFREVRSIKPTPGEIDELTAVAERWLNPPDVSETQLKKRTLTNLYSVRPVWSADAHAATDRAVWDAYGWPADEVPIDVEMTSSSGGC
jgi:hypothetical protein